MLCRAPFKQFDKPLGALVAQSDMKFLHLTWDKKIRHIGFGLVLILFVALVLRAWSLSFGLPSLNDQDELVFEMGAVRLLTTPTLNPKWFGHPGTTTIYGLALVDVCVFLFGHVASWWNGTKEFIEAIYNNPTLVMLPGRAMIVAFGLASIGLTYRLGTRLFSPVVGLIAAIILTVAPLHVTYSQIIRSDMMATVFMLLSVLQAVSVGRGERGLSAYFKAAAWAGVATATKWPFGIAVLALCGAAFLRYLNGGDTIRTLVMRLAAAGACMAMTLLSVSPFLVLDWQTVVSNLRGEARTFHLGATGGSFWWNLKWYVTQPLFDTLGIAGWLASGLGLVLLAFRRESRFMILPLVLAFVVLLCSQHLIWTRWCLPLLPFLAIGIGLVLEQLGTKLSQRIGHERFGAGLAVLTALAISTPLLSTSLADGRERMNDTRQLASGWLMANAAPGSTVLVEHFGFDLLKAPFRFRWPVGAAGCIDPRMLLRGKVTLKQIEAMRGGLSNVDFGTVSTNKMDSCRADYAIITQYDRYAAERSRFPVEFSHYDNLISSSDTVALFRPQPGISGGWVVRVLKRSTKPQQVQSSSIVTK